jgi:hypothetical protein
LLAAYNFEILYRKKALNLINKLSRRSDYEEYTEIRN